MRKISFILAALLPLVIVSCNKPVPDPVPEVPIKIIIDTDFQEGYDNIALSMLLKSNRVNVLGITTTSGNCWAQEAAAGVIRELELLGKTNIPVAVGQNKPIRDGRLDTFLDEIKKHPGYLGGNHGCLDTPEVLSWNSCYQTKYGGEPTLSVSTMSAPELINSIVNSNEGDVVIVSMGPATNVAKAIIQNAEFPKKVGGLILTGGAFYGVGDATESAEFNALFDPDAMKLCYESELPTHTIVPLDIVALLGMGKDRLNDLISHFNDPKMLDILNNSKPKKALEADPALNLYPKSLVAAATLLNSGFVTKTDVATLTLNDQIDSDEYGKTSVASISDKSRSVMLSGVNANAFWQTVITAIQ